MPRGAYIQNTAKVEPVPEFISERERTKCARSVPEVFPLGTFRHSSFCATGVSAQFDSFRPHPSSIAVRCISAIRRYETVLAAVTASFVPILFLCCLNATLCVCNVNCMCVCCNWPLAVTCVYARGACVSVPLARQAREASVPKGRKLV